MRAFMGLNLSPLITCSPQWSHRHVTLLGLPSTSVTHLAKWDFDGHGVLVIVFWIWSRNYATPGYILRMTVSEIYYNMIGHYLTVSLPHDACATFHPPGVPIFLFKKKFLLPSPQTLRRWGTANIHVVFARLFYMHQHTCVMKLLWYVCTFFWIIAHD